MSTFVLFKQKDVDPLLRNIFKPKDVPESFRNRIEFGDDFVIVDHRLVFKRGITFSFHDGRVLPASPLMEYYYPTPLGYVLNDKTFKVTYQDGKLFTLAHQGRAMFRETISIDDPMFDDALVFVHAVNKVFDFRKYFKENLQGK